MEWLTTLAKPLIWLYGAAMQGSNGKILSVFDQAPALVGNNIYLILIGLWLLKLIAKKTSWVGDDKIYTLLRGLVTAIMSGKFNQQGMADMLEKSLDDKTD